MSLDVGVCLVCLYQLFVFLYASVLSAELLVDCYVILNFGF